MQTVKGGRMDAIELLKHDHRIVEQMFRDYEAAMSDRQRRGVVEILIRELSKHAALEELIVYPLAKKRLTQGTPDVAEHLREHMAVKKTLAALDRLPEGSAEEAGLIAELRREIDHHVAEEEADFLPALGRAVDQQALDDLGRQLDRAKQLAPTRPHPGAPDRPPALALLAPAVAVYDRLRDRLQGRPPT
jgi:hemerythrin-like domain-containing protein